MKDFFIKQFNYDYWANNRYIDFLEVNNIKDNKPLIIISHIVLAQDTWRSRLNKEEKGHPIVWDILSFGSLREASLNNLSSFAQLISSINNYNETLNYKNIKGEQHENSVVDIFNHVLLHSTYHRGQLATLVRQLGFTPVATDYITYCREGK